MCLSCLQTPYSLMLMSIYYIIGWCSALVLITFATLAFSAYRKISKRKKECEFVALGSAFLEKSRFCRELHFHSPDDASRSFVQAGYERSLLGSAVFWLWMSVPAIGEIFLLWTTTVSYFPDAYVAMGFADWNDIAALWIFCFVLTHVAAAILIKLYPSMKVRCMLPCPLSDAQVVMIEELVDTDPSDSSEVDDEIPHVVARFAARIRGMYQSVSDKYRKAVQRSLVPVHNDSDCKWFEYTCVRHIWSETEGRFNPVGLLTVVRPSTSVAQLSAGGLSDTEFQKLQTRVGKNDIVVHVPGVLEAIATEFADLIYVYQTLGTWVYLFYTTWNVGTMWAVLIACAGTIKSLFIVRRNQQSIADMARLRSRSKVLRNGQYIDIPSTDIVLGDVVLLEDGNVVPCDGVLIWGGVVVNESMLTGEPMPIQKVPVEAHDSLTQLDTKRHKKHFVFAGTETLQSTGSEETGHKAAIYATGVGALTTKGQLVRMVLFPTAVKFKYNDQLPVVYFVMFVYSVMLMVIMTFTNIGSWVATFLGMACCVTQSLNPMVPVSLVMGQAVAAKRLTQKQKITVLQPGRIPIAGKISVMVFDKTGTITKEGMDFAGAHPALDGAFADLCAYHEPDALHPGSGGFSGALPKQMEHALASCHTVTTLRDGTLVGNQVEMAMVRAMGWKLPLPDEAAAQKYSVITKPGTSESLEVLKLIDFDHSRMTSGAVVRVKSTGKVFVFLKGSYERVSALVRSSGAHSRVPLDYDRVTEGHAANNFYVLGIAVREMPQSVSAESIATMSRDEIEMGGQLDLLGLLLFRNEMKHDSPEAIEKLRAGGVTSVMCTGDNALTGIAIAKQCGIIEKEKRVLLGDVDGNAAVDANGTQPVFFVDPQDDKNTRVAPVLGSDKLALTAGAWRLLLKSGDIEAVWSDCCVFARMKPEDKVNVIKFFQSAAPEDDSKTSLSSLAVDKCAPSSNQVSKRGFIVGMCGDGGNDCGALRAAHAGLALSESEASMVSPFSSGRDGKSLLTVVDLIRYGRACLATNIATFTFFIVYAFGLTYIKVYLTLLGNFMLSEWVWMTQDVLVSIVMIWTMTLNQPAKKLATVRPTASLLGARTLAGVFFPVVTYIIFQMIAYVLLWQQSWYDYVNTLDLHIKPQDWMKKGDNHDTPVGFFMLLTTLATAAYVSSYGGVHRANVMKNVPLNLMHFIVLGISFGTLWAQQCGFSCMYRNNCDMESSLLTDIPIINQWSVGNIGGCFLGPQIRRWQEFNSTFSTWTPAATDEPYACQPPVEVLDAVPLSAVSSNGSDGPTNIYSPTYKLELTLVMLGYIVANHLFAKLVLMGPGAAFFRRRRSQSA